MATAVTADTYLQQIHTARTQLHECFRRAHDLLAEREAHLLRELETIQSDYEARYSSMQDELQDLQTQKNDFHKNNTLTTINKALEEIITIDERMEEILKLSSGTAQTIRFQWNTDLDRDLQQAGEIITTTPQPANLSPVFPPPANMEPLSPQPANFTPYIPQYDNIAKVTPVFPPRDNLSPDILQYGTVESATPRYANVVSDISQPASNVTLDIARYANLSSDIPQNYNVTHVIPPRDNLSPDILQYGNVESVTPRYANVVSDISQPATNVTLDIPPRYANLSSDIPQNYNVTHVIPPRDNFSPDILQYGNVESVTPRYANLSPDIPQYGNVESATPRYANLTSGIPQNELQVLEVSKQTPKKNLSLKEYNDKIKEADVSCEQILNSFNFDIQHTGDIIIQPAIVAPPDYNKSMPVISCCKHNKGIAPGELYWPNAIAVEPQTGRIYIADSGNNRVQVFTPNGMFSFMFSSYMNSPWGICINNDTVYVSQWMGDCITAYKLYGRYIKMVGSKGARNSQFNGPTGLAVNTATGLLYVCDCSNHILQLFDKYLKFRSLFADKLVKSPSDVKLTQHLVIVLDRGDPCIHLFNNTDLLRNIISSGDDKQTINPIFITINRELNILLTDYGKHCVCMFSQSGVLITQFGKEGHTAGEFYNPTGIAIDNQNRIVVVSENKNNALQLF